MATQKHMGRNELLDRLAAQVGSKTMAEGILRKRGDMNADGSYTKKGAKRNAMTASERAVDRASRSSGKRPTNYKYNPKTNRATLKRKK